MKSSTPLLLLAQVLWDSEAFVSTRAPKAQLSLKAETASGTFFDALANLVSPKNLAPKKTAARDLVKSLVEDKKCFASADGVEAFVDACANDVVYEDAFEPEAFVGKEVRETRRYCLSTRIVNSLTSSLAL